MSRRYGPIGTSVWDSDKFLALENDTNRLGYLYLIACPHGNSVGVFRLPVNYFAADRRTDPETAEAMLADMESVGLIERGREDQIRITKWFWNDTGANNPSTASAFCKVFCDVRLVKRGDLRTRALVEMATATLTKAEGWNPDSAPFSKMVKDIQSLIAQECKRDLKAMRQALQQQPTPEPNTILHTVLDTVSYTVGGQGVAHLWDIEHEILKQETDTETDTGDRIRTTDNGNVGGIEKQERSAPSAPPSPPAEGSRSGRKVDEETARVIAELTAKSRRVK